MERYKSESNVQDRYNQYFNNYRPKDPYYAKIHHYLTDLFILLHDNRKTCHHLDKATLGSKQDTGLIFVSEYVQGVIEGYEHYVSTDNESVKLKIVQGIQKDLKKLLHCLNNQYAGLNETRGDITGTLKELPRGKALKLNWQLPPHHKFSYLFYFSEYKKQCKKHNQFLEALKGMIRDIESLSSPQALHSDLSRYESSVNKLSLEEEGEQHQEIAKQHIDTLKDMFDGLTELSSKRVLWWLFFIFFGIPGGLGCGATIFGAGISVFSSIFSVITPAILALIIFSSYNTTMSNLAYSMRMPSSLIKIRLEVRRFFRLVKEAEYELVVVGDYTLMPGENAYQVKKSKKRADHQKKYLRKIGLSLLFMLSIISSMSMGIFALVMFQNGMHKIYEFVPSLSSGPWQWLVLYVGVVVSIIALVNVLPAFSQLVQELYKFIVSHTWEEIGKTLLRKLHFVAFILFVLIAPWLLGSLFMFAVLPVLFFGALLSALEKQPEEGSLDKHYRLNEFCTLFFTGLALSGVAAVCSTSELTLMTISVFPGIPPLSWLLAIIVAYAAFFAGAPFMKKNVKVSVNYILNTPWPLETARRWVLAPLHVKHNVDIAFNFMSVSKRNSPRATLLNILNVCCRLVIFIGPYLVGVLLTFILTGSSKPGNLFNEAIKGKKKAYDEYEYFKASEFKKEDFCGIGHCFKSAVYYIGFAGFLLLDFAKNIFVYVLIGSWFGIGEKGNALGLEFLKCLFDIDKDDKCRDRLGKVFKGMLLLLGIFILNILRLVFVVLLFRVLLGKVFLMNALGNGMLTLISVLQAKSPLFAKIGGFASFIGFSLKSYANNFANKFLHKLPFSQGFRLFPEDDLALALKGSAIGPVASMMLHTFCSDRLKEHCPLILEEQLAHDTNELNS